MMTLLVVVVGVALGTARLVKFVVEFVAPVTLIPLFIREGQVARSAVREVEQT